MDYDADIQVLAQKVARNGQLAISVTNDELLRSSVPRSNSCAMAALEEYCGFINAVKIKTDSIQYLVDSLSKNNDIELLFAVQKILYEEPLSIGEMSDWDRNTKSKLLRTLRSDWLYQSYKNDTKDQHHTVLEQEKINSLLLERFVLNNFITRVAAYDCFIDKFQPVLNWKSISPTIGDTMYAVIYPSGYTEDDDRNKFTINGIPFADQKFRQRFNQAGTYPLHIKVERDDWAHDTVLVAEKTYYITVRK